MPAIAFLRVACPAVLLLAVSASTAWAQANDAAFEQWVDLYAQRMPKRAEDCTPQVLEPFKKAADMVESLDEPF